MNVAVIDHPTAGSSPGRLRSLDRRGVAALEFAMMAPVLLIMLMFMYDAANGWITWQRLTQASRSVAQIATLMAVNADGTNTLSHDQAWRASTAVYAAMPETFAAGATYGVTMTEVLFTGSKVRNATVYVANVAWSKTLLGVAPRRLCGTLSVTGNTAASSLSTLPQDAFQAAPLLVVDVTYTFNPLFLGSLIGAIPMAWSAYLPVRSGTLDQTISYEDPLAGCVIARSPKETKETSKSDDDR